MLILFFIADLFAHWIDQWSLPPLLTWKAASELALESLLRSIVWYQLLKIIQSRAEITAQYGFEVILKRLSSQADQECCQISVKPPSFIKQDENLG